MAGVRPTHVLCSAVAREHQVAVHVEADGKGRRGLRADAGEQRDMRQGRRYEGRTSRCTTTRCHCPSKTGAGVVTGTIKLMRSNRLLLQICRLQEGELSAAQTARWRAHLKPVRTNMSMSATHVTFGSARRRTDRVKPAFSGRRAAFTTERAPSRRWMSAGKASTVDRADSPTRHGLEGCAVSAERHAGASWRHGELCGARGAARRGERYDRHELVSAQRRACEKHVVAVAFVGRSRVTEGPHGRVGRAGRDGGCGKASAFVLHHWMRAPARVHVRSPLTAASFARSNRVPFQQHSRSAQSAADPSPHVGPAASPHDGVVFCARIPGHQRRGLRQVMRCRAHGEQWTDSRYDEGPRAPHAARDHDPRKAHALRGSGRRA
jgi:hypothetical protein